VVLKEGTLKVGDDIYVDAKEARVRGLFNWEEKRIKEVQPGYPALILGFGFLPPVGSIVRSEIGKEETEIEKKRDTREVKEGEISVIIKAQSEGSLEAVIDNIPDKIVVISSGVGEVTESDVFMAKAASARIFAFESKVSNSVLKLGETEGVKIEKFKIIYKLFDRLNELLEEKRIKIDGKAKIVAIFPYENRKVAGCKVVSGKILKSNKMLVTRGEETLKEVKVISMKKQKEDIDEAREGEECGIIFVPQLDFQVGDMLVSLSKKQ
jgi:translation initiation factor IF-2